MVLLKKRERDRVLVMQLADKRHQIYPQSPINSQVSLGTFFALRSLVSSLRNYIVIFVSSLIATTVFANAGSRGGGNGVVCFANPAIAQSLTVRNPSTGGVVYYKSIPDDVQILSNIVGIEMFDLYLVDHVTTVDKKKTSLISLLSNQKKVSLPAQVADLEQEYSHIISRYKEAMPRAYEELNGMQDVLALNKAVMYHPLNPVYDVDVEQLGVLPTNCILATIAEQKGDDFNASWAVDERLFWNPLNSKLSQVVTLLHERSYMLARSKERVDLTSNNAIMFVQETISAASTYRTTLTRYEQLNPRSQNTNMWLSDCAPCDFVSSIKFNLLKTAAGQIAVETAQLGSPQFRDILIGTSETYLDQAFSLYQTHYREDLINYPLLPKKLRLQIDKNLTNYYGRKKPPFLLDDWTQQILDLPIPLPGTISK